MLLRYTPRVMHERRSPQRPRVGDLRRCECCGHVMRFQMRYVVDDARVADVDPAWICANSNCRAVERMRRAQGEAA